MTSLIPSPAKLMFTCSKVTASDGIWLDMGLGMRLQWGRGAGNEAAVRGAGKEAAVGEGVWE